MQAINYSFCRRIRTSRQNGVAAVEFAFVAIIFFTVLFGTLELARVMYIFNTLQEVTRRAAAQASSTDFTNGAAMQKVREGAVFRTAPGTLMFADPVTDAHVRIDYLAITNDGAGLKTAPVHTLPTSPDDNYQICMTDPHDAGCIRMVRVRICQPGTGEACEAVPYRPMLTLVPFPLTLPPSTTIVVAETLGRPAGLPPALSAPLSE